MTNPWGARDLHPDEDESVITYSFADALKGLLFALAFFCLVYGIWYLRGAPEFHTPPGYFVR